MAPKLLIVEDDVRLLAEIANALRGAGYEVTTALSFLNALDYLTGDEGYAAILSDFNLGRQQTGANVFQAANRAFRPRPAFIATSGEMEKWADYVSVFKLHLVPKVDYHWNAPAILAKLAELDIRP